MKRAFIMNTALFLKLFLICVLASASLLAHAATTPLNELTNPDERGFYCKTVVGTSLISAAVRSRDRKGSQQDATSMMQTIQTVKSWEKEIARLYPTKAAQRVFTGKVSVHYNKHLQAHMKKASVNLQNAQLHLVDQDLKNCDKELVSYQKRTLPKPKPVVAAKPKPPATPKPVHISKPKAAPTQMTKKSTPTKATVAYSTTPPKAAPAKTSQVTSKIPEPVASTPVANGKSRTIKFSTGNVYIGNAFYTSQKLEISPSLSGYKNGKSYQRTMDQWCSNADTSDSVKTSYQLIAIYDVDHDKRKTLFSPNYDKFVDSHIKTKIQKVCGKTPTSIKITMLKKGDQMNKSVMAFWLKNGSVDRSRERLNRRYKKTTTQEAAVAWNTGSGARKAGTSPPVVPKTSSIKPNMDAEEGYDTWRVPCSGPFCHFSGGSYLNAIYLNDEAMIMALDTRLAKGAENSLRGMAGATNWNNLQQALNASPQLSSIAKKVTDGYKTASILHMVAEKYLYHYKAECLGPDAKGHTFRYTEPSTRTTTMSGLDMGTTKGKTYKATYVVNPEFYPLMKRVGHHAGDIRRSWFGKTAGFNGPGYTFNGVGQLLDSSVYTCKSPEVKQFEKNLIHLTTRLLDELR